MLPPTDMEILQRGNNAWHTSNHENNISALSLELILLVLKELSAEDLAHFSSTSKLCQKYCLQLPSLWQWHCAKEFFELKKHHASSLLSQEEAIMHADPRAYYYLLKNGFYTTRTTFHPRARIVCMTSTEDMVILGEKDGTIQFYKFINGHVLEFNPQQCTITCLKTHENLLFYGTNNGFVGICNLCDLGMQTTFQLVLSHATSFDIHDNKLIIGCYNGHVFIFDVESNAFNPHQIAHYNRNKIDKVSANALSDKRLITASAAGDIFVEDLQDLNCIEFYHEGDLDKIAEDNETLAIYTSDEIELNRPNYYNEDVIEKKICIFDLKQASKCDFEEDYICTYEFAINPIDKLFTQKTHSTYKDSTDIPIENDFLKKEIYHLDCAATKTMCNGHEIVSIVDGTIDVWKTSTLKHRQDLDNIGAIENGNVPLHWNIHVANSGRHLCIASKFLHVWRKDALDIQTPLRQQVQEASGPA